MQLQDMGFSAGLASKALLLSHNVPAAALEWALQHSEDGDADAPPSEDALRAGGGLSMQRCCPVMRRLATLANVSILAPE